ncbi:MAG: hypothetical protein R3B90_20940 [Planctomycetaceae bacterium]
MLWNRCFVPTCVIATMFTIPTLPAEDVTVPSRFSKLELGPDTTRIVGPLNKYGYPDYARALDAELAEGVGRDENFWALMWPAVGNAERSREDYLRAVEQRLNIQISREPRLMTGSQIGVAPFSANPRSELDTAATPWSRADAPELAAWLDENADNLNEVHAAALRPKAYAPLVYNSEDSVTLAAILLPHVQMQRQVARVLAARAMLRINDGDMDGAWSDITDIYRIAAHTERGFTLIEQLVGYAMRQIAQTAMVQWLAHADLSADELEARWTELKPLLPVDSLARSIEGERYLYLDTVCLMLSGRSDADAAMSLFELDAVVLATDDSLPAGEVDRTRTARQAMIKLILAGADVNETLRYGNVVYDELAAAMDQPTHGERAALLADIEQRVSENAAITKDTGELLKAYFLSGREAAQQVPARVLVGLLTPAITQCEVAQTRVQANAACLEAAFAAKSFAIEHGRLPTSLNEIINSGRPQPTDPFTGDALKFRADAESVTIYSVGRNGVDDAGQPQGNSPQADDLPTRLNLAR